MSLTLRQKQSLYHSLGQLVRSGIPFPKALDKLASTMRGDARRLIEAARKSLAAGHTVGEAFAAQPSVVTPLEVAVVSAVEKSGQLERGLADLSQYFGALDQARRSVIQRCLYPLFTLHFGVMVINLRTILTHDLKLYLHNVGVTFLVLYGVAMVIGFAVPLLRDMGAISGVVDRCLNLFPVLGNIRRSFAYSRFCAVYGLQLDAGINVIDAVMSAGRSSRSGLVQSAVDAAVPEIRGGSQVGPLLAASGAFPSDLAQALIVGEETGALDNELRRMAAEYRDQALSSLQILADWLPKLLNIAVILYVGWGIISFYRDYYALVDTMLK